MTQLRIRAEIMELETLTEQACFAMLVTRLEGKETVQCQMEKRTVVRIRVRKWTVFRLTLDRPGPVAFCETSKVNERSPV